MPGKNWGTRELLSWESDGNLGLLNKEIHKEIVGNYGFRDGNSAILKGNLAILEGDFDCVPGK